jgi:hypothetical protein
LNKKTNSTEVENLMDQYLQSGKFEKLTIHFDVAGVGYEFDIGDDRFTLADLQNLFQSKPQIGPIIERCLNIKTFD